MKEELKFEGDNKFLTNSYFTPYRIDSENRIMKSEKEIIRINRELNE